MVTSRFDVDIRGSGWVFGVKFRPGGLVALTGVGPARAWADRTLPAAGIVPDDVAVCGFDDTPSTMLSTPPLTTIRQPVTEMAAVATRLLLPATRGQPGQAEKVDYALIERLSTQSSG